MDNTDRAKTVQKPCTHGLQNKKAMKSFDFTAFSGAMEGTRTPGLLIRSQSLYPAELPTHTFRSEQDVFYHGTTVLSTSFLKIFWIFRKRTSFGKFSRTSSSAAGHPGGNALPEQGSRPARTLWQMPSARFRAFRHAICRQKGQKWQIFYFSVYRFCHSCAIIALLMFEKMRPCRDTGCGPGRFCGKFMVRFPLQKGNTEGKSYETGKRGNS